MKLTKETIHGNIIGKEEDLNNYFIYINVFNINLNGPKKYKVKINRHIYDLIKLNQKAVILGWVDKTFKTIYANKIFYFDEVITYEFVIKEEE